MRQIIISYCFFLSISGFGQNLSINWSELANLPESVSNNAVTQATINGEVNIFSFAGIDSTINYSGIHLKGFRYSVSEDNWYSIPALPDTLGKVAAGASTVKNKIYIIGGYHVYANGHEKSSDRVHIYDPETNQYLPDGAAIPIQIDDHVQAVWRDSLIYVMTGWSDNKNVPDVQIYDPALNSWQVGTSVPSNLPSVVFGGSGVIIGDTIFYAGGARFGTNFPLVSVMRIGIIDPNNPENITWSAASDPLALGYRMGAFSYKNEAYWIGGSTISYNYDGIAYNGSGPVSPEKRILRYDTQAGNLTQLMDTISPIMDVRGMGMINDHQFIIAGGMENGPVVSKKTFLISFDDGSTNSIEPEQESFVSINQEGGKLLIRQNERKRLNFNIYDLSGQEVLSGKIRAKTRSLNVSNLSAGIYFIKIMHRKKIDTIKFLLN